MNDTRESRMRSAVREIVDNAPLAPTVDYLAGRSAPRPRRSRLLLPVIAVLIVAAAAALTSRLDDRVGTELSTTIDSSTSVPLSSEVTATDAFRILREGQMAAVGNVDTMAGPLIQSCMAAKGFTFSPNSSVLMTEEDQNSFLRRRYPEPRQQDGLWGYIFETPATNQDAIEPPTPSVPDAQAPAYLDAFNGNEVASEAVRDLDGHVAAGIQIGDGCYGQAMTTIFGSAQAYVDFYTNLSRLEMLTGLSYATVRNDPAYVANNSLWAECMKNAGFEYSTLADPWNQEWRSPRPSAEEQHVAQADSICRQGKDLDSAHLLEVEEDALGALLVAHPIGNYDEFELQVRSLVAGRFPVSIGGATSATSTMPT